MDNTLPQQEEIQKKSILANKKLVIAAIALIIASAVAVILLNIIRVNQPSTPQTSKSDKSSTAALPSIKTSFVPPIFIVESAQKQYEAKIITEGEAIASRIEIAVSVESANIETAILKANPYNVDWEIDNGFYNKDLNLVTLTLIPKGKKVAIAKNPIATLVVTPKKGLSNKKIEVMLNPESVMQLDNGNNYRLTANPATIVHPDVAPLME